MLVAPKLRICRSESIPRQLHRCVRSFKRQDPRLVLTPWSNSEHFRCCPRTCRPLRDTLGALRWHKAGEHAPMSDIRRRQFITLLGGAAVAWPLAARAQQGERVRRIGVLQSLIADDPEGQARLAVFAQGLQESGWIIGRNVRIDTRWTAGDDQQIRKYAAELVALVPDVILVVGASGTGSLLQATRTVPIVFVNAVDPVGAGFVDSLARPGGNTTGFMTAEYSISGKLLELLKEIAPRVTRVAVLRDSALAAGSGQLGAIQSVAPSFGVELRPIDVRDVGKMESAFAAFALSLLSIRMKQKIGPVGEVLGWIFVSIIRFRSLDRVVYW